MLIDVKSVKKIAFLLEPDMLTMFWYSFSGLEPDVFESWSLRLQQVFMAVFLPMLKSKTKCCGKNKNFQFCM